MKTILNRGDREDLRARIGKLNADSKPNWGKMNVNQMLCHLIDQLRVAMGEEKAELTGNVFTYSILKWLALRFLPIPRGTKTAKEMLLTSPTEFVHDRESLLKLISALADLSDTSSKKPHPVFGDMTHQEWCRLSYKHIDYHLRQFGV